MPKVTLLPIFVSRLGIDKSRAIIVKAGSRKPCPLKLCNRAQAIAKQVTDNIGGLGLFGVELFIQGDQVWFSEVSPRPHDTGMVTMVTQRQNEFECHVRAILGLPVSTHLLSEGASAVILGGMDADAVVYSGLESAWRMQMSVFVCLANLRLSPIDVWALPWQLLTTIDNARDKARDAAKQIIIKPAIKRTKTIRFRT